MVAQVQVSMPLQRDSRCVCVRVILDPWGCEIWVLVQHMLLTARYTKFLSAGDWQNNAKLDIIITLLILPVVTAAERL